MATEELPVSGVDETPGSSARRSPLREPVTWVGVAVTCGLLYLAAPKEAEEWERTREAFEEANYRWLPAFLGLLAGFYALKAWRWTLLLRPLGRFGVREVAGSMMAGFGFNNVLPAHAGEGVRTLLFARRAGLSKTAVLATVALERLFDLIAITLFLAAGLATVEGLGDTVRAAGTALAAITLAGTAGALAYVFFTARVLALVRWAFRVLPLPERFEAKVLELAELGAAGLASVKSPGLLAGILASSIVQWAMNGLLAWIALEMFGLRASLPLACVLLGVIAFSVTIPSTPGYFGVIQAAFWGVLQTVPGFADQKGTVFAASVFYHLAQYVPVTMVGLGWFFAMGVPVRDLFRPVGQAPPAGGGGEASGEPEASAVSE